MQIKDKLRFLINIWVNSKIPANIIERPFDYSLYIAGTPSQKIITFTGARRVGKTYFLYQIIKHFTEPHGYEDSKNKKIIRLIPKNNTLYINMNDSRLFPISKEGFELDLLLTTFYEVEEIDVDFPLFIFIDNISQIPNWYKWIENIYNNEQNVHFFITASQEDLFENDEIRRSLAGIVDIITIYPFSFREFLSVKHQNTSDLFDTKLSNYSEIQNSKLQRFLMEYVYFGGLPEVILSSDSDVKKQDYIQKYLQQFVINECGTRLNITNISALSTLIFLLLNDIDLKKSYSSLAKDMKKYGVSLSKVTIIKYIEGLEKLNTLFHLKIFKQLEESKDTSKIFSKIYYFLDPSLINFNSLKNLNNDIVLYRNLIYIELLRRKKIGQQIFYWGKGNKNEKRIDFIIMQETQMVNVIQLNLSLNRVNKEDIIPIYTYNFLSVNMIRKLTILTNNLEEKRRFRDIAVEYIPLYMWLVKKVGEFI